MSIAISTSTSSLLHSSSASSGGKISYLCSFSNSAVPVPKNAIFKHIKCVPQLGLAPFTQWSGLKGMGVSISQYSTERKGKCKGKGVYASLFGVGAPEVLVIGVVALLVFGPKGLLPRLAYFVARNLGKTLRTFQPTIRELQEVSREFKSTLEREIGLDDINPVPRSYSSNRTQPKPETDIEPNEEDAIDNSLKLRANQFVGALEALKKEQEEEERQKEEEQQLQAQVEQQTTSEDTGEVPADTPEEASPVTPSTQNLSSNSLQEAAAVPPSGSATTTETQS